MFRKPGRLQFKNIKVNIDKNILIFYGVGLFVKGKGKRQFPGVYTEVKIDIRP